MRKPYNVGPGHWRLVTTGWGLETRDHNINTLSLSPSHHTSHPGPGNLLSLSNENWNLAFPLFFPLIQVEFQSWGKVCKQLQRLKAKMLGMELSYSTLVINKCRGTKVGRCYVNKNIFLCLSHWSLRNMFNTNSCMIKLNWFKKLKEENPQGLIIEMIYHASHPLNPVSPGFVLPHARHDDLYKYLMVIAKV